MVLKQYDVTPNMGKVHIHEISYRFIAHLIGQLLAFESMLLCVCCCMSMIYGESDLMSFIVSFHYCPVKILDLEINRVDHHPLGR